MQHISFIESLAIQLHLPPLIHLWFLFHLHSLIHLWFQFHLHSSIHLWSTWKIILKIILFVVYCVTGYVRTYRLTYRYTTRHALFQNFVGFRLGRESSITNQKKNHLQSFVYAMFVEHSWYTHLHHHCFFVCTFVVCNSVCSYIVCYAHQYASMCIHSILKALQMIFFFVCYRALPSQPKTHEISK